MDFMEFPPPRKRRTIVLHVMIIFVAVVSLAAFSVAEDEITGKVDEADAYGFTLIFMLAAYYLGWLPEIWEKTDKTPVEPFVMPTLILMIIAYLYLSFRSYFIQPGVTGMIVFLQMFVMIGASCRIA